ncbi:Catsper1 [Symbiodinium sp. CCMP2592]|nr:Catsper1 [Symbiodinium sp. CCMP2592]
MVSFYALPDIREVQPSEPDEDEAILASELSTESPGVVIPVHTPLTFLPSAAASPQAGPSQKSLPSVSSTSGYSGRDLPGAASAASAVSGASGYHSVASVMSPLSEVSMEMTTSDATNKSAIFPRKLPDRAGQPDAVPERRNPKLTKAFQSLLDALVQQHVTELRDTERSAKRIRRSMDNADAARNLQKNLPHSRSTPTQMTNYSPNGVVTPGSEVGTMSQEPTKLKLGRGSTTSQQLLCRQRQGMPEVNADKVLEAFAVNSAPSQKSAASVDRELLEMLDSADVVEPGNRQQTSATFGFFSETESNILKRWRSLSARQKLKAWLQSNSFEILISCALCINVLWMAFELQVHGSMAGFEIGVFPTPLMPKDTWPTWEAWLLVGDMIFAGFFALDVVVRVLVLGLTFWKSWMNYIDVIVSAISVMELTATFYTLPVNPILFRLLRMGKLTRAIRVVSMTSVLASLQLLIKCLAASRDMLFWSFCLLTFVQCVAGMVVSTLCWEYLRDENFDAQLREDVFRYYGTFSRTFLSMFEILFANWSPPCRVLVEHVSEWFSIFFLLYRCVLGFAVLNVVNAVFVQQTMKTASSDEDLAFKQKEKDIAMYHRKVKKLFATMDSSGDGAINFDEFSKLVKSPKLRFWMSQLELEYHDLLSLFEFLDNGDGQITLHEFIDGASRLKGHAKAIDIWRMETKVEVLFEEVLHILRGDDKEETMELAEPQSPEARKISSIQEVFDHSAFRHIKATTFVHDPSNSGEVQPATTRPMLPADDPLHDHHLP